MREMTSVKGVSVFASSSRPNLARLVPLLLALAVPVAGVACGTRVESKVAAAGPAVMSPSGPTSGAFAADVNPDLGAFMADSQVPWGIKAFAGAVSQPAWKSKPSWYLVSTEDKMIPPDAQRAMSKRAGSKVVESKGSHAVCVSHPDAVASLIEEAALGSVSTASTTAA